MFTLKRREGEGIEIVVDKTIVKVELGGISEKKAELHIDLPNNCSIWIDGLKYTPSDKPPKPGTTYREVELRTED